MSRSVTVSVAGHKLSLRTDAKPAYIRELVSFVTRQLDEAKSSGRAVPSHSVALLAALNIADELFQLRKRERELKRQVRERSERILAYLDQEAGGQETAWPPQQ